MLTLCDQSFPLGVNGFYYLTQWLHNRFEQYVWIHYCFLLLLLSTLPMKRLFKVLPLFLFFAFSVTKSLGQFVDETDCSNGMDDGGDSFIDCFDSDCAGDNACTEFFFGNDAVCLDAPQVTDFSVNLQWKSDDQTANSHASPIVGDLDQDGIPEVVVNNRQNRTVTILNGEDGSTHRQVDLGWQPENVMALANVRGDDCAFIFAYEDQGNDMAMLDCELNVIWKTPDDQPSVAQNAIGNPAFADFNEDGVAELYHRNEIRDAETGNVLVDGLSQLNTGEDWLTDIIAASVAIDLYEQNEIVDGVACVDCQGLELAAGRYIYSVNLATGNLTEIKDINADLLSSGFAANQKYFPKKRGSTNQWSGVSVADYNQDGNIDILMSGALGTDFSGQTTVFFWDVENSTVDTYGDPGNNNSRGTGRLNIADLDGDGQLNVNYVSGNVLYSLDENLNVLWFRIIDEVTSGFTGMTLFDFDDDGIVETVYRSEHELLVINGIDGTDRISPINCVSRTQEEYPIVADIDGDGASEICVTCYTDDGNSFEPYDNTVFSQVRVYQAGGSESWQPSRSVWNQTSYFNVNINDDLTVPIQQQDHSVVFSNGVCTTGNNRVLNTFMVQSPLLNEDGCSNYVTPDLDLGTTLTVTGSQCPNVEFDITFDIGNTGDVTVSGSVPVTFYAGDPFVPGSVQLNTVIVSLINLGIGQTRQFTETVRGVGGDFTLFVVINDVGGTPPISIKPASIPECGDGTNNIGSVEVVSDVFMLTVEKVSDNRKCLPAGAGLPDNGEARAYYEGSLTTQNTLYLETFDDLSINTTSDDGSSTTPPSAWNRTVAPSTDFARVVDNNSNNVFGTNDTDGIVTWTSGTIDITGFTNVSIRADMFAEGPMETSGTDRDIMEVKYSLDNGVNFIFLNQGNGIANFGYQQATISGLSGDNLIVQVQFDTQNNDEFYYLDNVNVSGFITTPPQQFTEADGVVFEWYDAADVGLTTILHSGSTYPTMADGDYLVQGYFSQANCFSNVVPLTIDLDQTSNFFAHAYEVSPLTNCGIPDGEVTAFAYTFEDSPGVPGDTLTAGYTFAWTFTTGGVTTLGTAPTLSNLDADQYRVTIRENLTGCDVSFDVDVTTTLVDPGDIEVVTTPIHVATCDGTGEISAFVDDDPGAGVSPNTTDYTFEWYNGTEVKATPDFTGITYTGLLVGDYTVRAVQTAASCPSLGVPEEVLDNSNDPTPGITSQVNNSTCSIANGSASINGDGLGTTAGYTFVWYLGDNTLPTNELPAALPGAAFGAGDFEMTGLIESAYRVVVEETATRCSTEILVDILDVPITPVLDPLSVVLTDNSSCSVGPPNGTIDASGTVTPAGSYTYRLYQGFTLVTELSNNPTGLFSGLATGDYTVVAEDAASECPSLPESFSIDTNPDNPTIVTAVVDDTHCDGAATFTGEIAVTSSSSTSTSLYQYELFDGAGFSTLLATQVNVNGVTGFSFTGLENGTYRIRATDENLTCDSFVDVQVGDAPLTPTFTANSPFEINNSSCLVPNGAMSVQIVGDSESNYDFAWYDGDVVGVGLRPIDVTNSIGGLAAGKYTVVATHRITNCSTIQATGEIFDAPTFPDISIVSQTDQTDCAGGDGTAQVQIDDLAGLYGCNGGICDDSNIPLGFTYRWYIGSGTGGLPTGGNSTSISGLAAGVYTFEVIDPLGCSNTEEVTIGLSELFPLVTLNGTTDNTGCDAGSYDGTVTFDVVFDGVTNPNFTGYTFTIYQGSGTGGAVEAVGSTNTFGSLDGGLYTVEVQAPNSCTSSTLEFTIVESLATPAFEVNTTGVNTVDNTVCDVTLAGAFNGQITVTTTDATAENLYAYQWFVGVSTMPADDLLSNIATASISGNIASQLPGGTYTVEVTGMGNVGSNCTTIISHTIADTPSVIFDAYTIIATATNVTACDGSAAFPNGGVMVDVADITANGDGSGVYEFRYYIGNSTSGTLIVDGSDINSQKGNPANGVNVTGATTATISGLDPGTYTVEAIDLETGCTALPVVTTIIEQSTHTPTASEAFSSTGCNIGNGQAEADGDGLGGVIGYTFTWYLGPNDTDSSLELPGTAVPNAFLLNGNPYELGGLAPGVYTVRVIDDNTLCSAVAHVTITDTKEEPLLIDENDIVVTDVMTCDPGNDGAVDISKIIDNVQTRAYEGFFSDNLGNPIAINNEGVFTELTPGSYTFFVIDNFTGCQSDPINIIVDDASVDPVFEVNSDPNETMDNTVCDPALASSSGNAFNGQVSLSPLDASTPDQYTYEWFAGASTDPLDDLATNVLSTSFNPDGNVAMGLPGGTYTVIVTDVANLGNGCTTTLEHTIIDSPDTNFTGFNLITDATATDVTTCTGGANDPNGTLTLDITALDALPASGNYTFRYYIGNSVTATPDGTDATATYQFTDLAAGNYTVEAVDNGSGCVTLPLTLTIGSSPVTPAFEVNTTRVNTVDNTVCDVILVGAFNGQITVTTTNATAETLYAYEWFVGASTLPTDDLITNIATASISATGNVASQLPGGTYTVRITDMNLGGNTSNNCQTIIQHTIIDDLTDQPVIDMLGAGSTKIDLTVCEDDATWPNGIINANATGGSGNYTYNWYYGSSVDIARTISNGDDIATIKSSGSSAPNALVTGATTASIQNLDPGFYTLIVTDTDRGCLSAKETFELVDNQASVDWSAGVAQDNYACSGSTPTGEVTVTVNSGTSTYTLEWYNGGSATGIPFTTNANVTVNQTESALDDGTYTIKVIDDATTCFITETVTVNEFIPDLAVGTSSLPQTNCTPNGEVTATPATLFTPTGPPATYVGGNYSYAWFLGSGTSTPLVEGTDGTNVTSANVTNMFAGFYTVVVTDTEIGCVASLETVEVVDGISAQTPTASISGLNAGGAPRNTPNSCAAENGRIVADITGSGTYTYQWYEGSLDFANDPGAGIPMIDTGNPDPSTTYATSQGASAAYVVDDAGGFRTDLVDVTSGIYTLVMTDITTGCRYQETYNLPFNDQQTTTTLVIKHVESCPDDGDAAVGIANTAGYMPGGVDDIEQYIIYLFAGAGVPSEIFTDTTFTYAVTNDDGSMSDYPLILDPLDVGVSTGEQVTFSTLPPGTYTALARERADAVFSVSQCWSAPAVNQIEDRAFEPILQSFSITDNSACNTPPAANFTGEVTVMATKDVNDRVQPGSFRFIWFDEVADSTHGTPLQTNDMVTTSTLSNLAAGTYGVDIYRVFDVLDINYVSGGAFGNGETLTFNGGTGTGVILTDNGTDMQVYLTSGVVSNGNAILGNESGNTGTVTTSVVGALDLNSRCVINEVYTVNDNLEIHSIIGPLSVTDAFDCTPNDSGIITVADANVTSGAVADYFFAFYPTLADAQANTNALQGFSALPTYSAPAPAVGTYYVVAQHQASGCESAPFEVDIDKTSVDPVITLVGSDDTSCDLDANEGNGSIQFTIDNAIDGDYDYQWYVGTDTGTPLVATGSIANESGTINDPGPYTATLSGIDAGTYTLEIIDRTTLNLNCAVLSTITINELSVNPIIVEVDNFTLQNNENCTSENGSIEITSVKENGVDIAVTPSNYTFSWFKDGAIFMAPTDGNIIGTVGTGNSITGLVGATYSVSITNTATQCTTIANVEIVLDNIQIDPIVQAETQTDDTYCDNTTNVGDGTLSVDFFHDGTQLDAPTTNDNIYTVEWYRGTLAVAPGIADPAFLFDNQANLGTAANRGDATVGLDISVLTGLADDTYTVFLTQNGAGATNPNLGCEVFATYTIGDNPASIAFDQNEIAQISITDNTNCSPANGEIQIFGVEEDDTFIDFASNLNYSLAWSSANPFTNNMVDVANDHITDLAGGTYSVVITNTTTSCVTASIDVLIEDNSVDPIIQLAAISGDPYCDNTNNAGGGSLELDLLHDGVQLDNPTTSVFYVVEWYRGIHATAPGIGDAATFLFDNQGNNGTVGTRGDATAGADITLLSGLAEGDYSVFVSKTAPGVPTPNVGCAVFASFSIGKDEPTITIDPVTEILFSDNFNCASPNGFIELLSVTEDGVPQTGGVGEFSLADYTITWYVGGIPFVDGTDGTLANSNGFGGSSTSIEDLDEGLYTVSVSNEVTGCFTSTAGQVDINITDELVDPIIQITAQSDDTYCDNTNNAGNGSVKISVSHPGDLGAVNNTAYTIEWYRGTQASRPGIGDASFIFDNQNNTGVAQGDVIQDPANADTDFTELIGMADGTYTVYVAKNRGAVSAPNFGCEALTTITIGDNPSTITIDPTINISQGNNFNCTSHNGFIELISVSEDGVAGAVALSNYTIVWEHAGIGFMDPADGTLSNPLGSGGTFARIDDLDAGTYSITVTNEVTGCTSSTQVDIDLTDETVTPVVQIETGTVQNDTFCDNTNNMGNGALSVDIFHDAVQIDPVDANQYVVEWYRGTTVQTTAHVDFLFDNQSAINADANVIGDALAGADISDLTGLSAGDYTIFISKIGSGAMTPNFGCDIETTFTVPKVEDIPTLDEAAIMAAKVDNTNCVPALANFNGSITINDDDVTGTLNDYEIIIYQGPIAGGVIVHRYTNTGSPSILEAQLGQNEYNITARNTTTGCSASSVRVNIEDMNFTPGIQLVSITDNLNCVGGTDITGSISITADGFNETNPNYQFQWHMGSGTGSPIAGQTNASLVNRVAGTYTVSVDNSMTGCSSTQEFTISDLDDDPVITTVAVTDQTICSANGAFTLLEVMQTGVLLDEAAMDAEGYTLEVFRASDDAPQGIPVTTSPYEISNLGIDSYYAIVTNNASNCPSNRVDFEVADAIVFPVIELTVTNDDPCSLGNGGIVATADGMDDTDPNYVFNWYFYDIGTMTRGALIANASSISAQEGGFFQLEVTFTPSGCMVAAVAEIFENDPINPEIDALVVTGATNCAPADGSIAVTSLNQDTPQDYRFDLYENDPTAGGAIINTIIPGTDPVLFESLNAGDYWIIVTSAIRGCVSATPLQVTVEDLSTPPVIAFTDFVPNTRCDPTIPNGSITAEADGSTSTNPATGYTWAWTGVDQSGTPVAALPNSATVTNIPAGTYDLTVTNNATGCITVADPYILTDESPAPLNISVSTSSNTNCVSFNGRMAATVIQPNFPLDEYDYLWFEGTVVNPNLSSPDFTGSLIENLANGSYTLVVRDTPGINDICQSAVIPVFIEDDRNMDFTPMVEIVNDVTFCYEDLPTGHAQVTNEDLGQFRIEWFEGSFDPLGTGAVLRTGFFIDSLAVNNYHVRMTNLITGCEFTTDFSIIDATEPVDNPNVTLISDNTHCTVPNGEAIATVNGATQSILFEWFDSDDTGLSTILFTGSQQQALGQGNGSITYLVRATNLITGCVSATSSVTVDNVITDPIFEIVSTNSLCLRTEDGAINQFNGEAFIRFSSLNFVETAIWTNLNTNQLLTFNTTGEPITQSGVGGLVPADYSVSFIADNGCTYEATFNINTEVQVFNFVTANGDTRNDFLLIDCLDFYPNNNVKIFTRAGQKVFEIDAYDNFGKRFDGTSDRGKALPSGTYFYIVDRGDGSELVQGYLELVR